MIETANARRKHAGQHIDLRKATAKVPHEHAGHIQQLVDQFAAGHNLTRQNEHRHGEKGKGSQPVEHRLIQDQLRQFAPRFDMMRKA